MSYIPRGDLGSRYLSIASQMETWLDEVLEGRTLRIQKGILRCATEFFDIGLEAAESAVNPRKYSDSRSRAQFLLIIDTLGQIGIKYDCPIEEFLEGIRKDMTHLRDIGKSLSSDKKENPEDYELAKKFWNQLKNISEGNSVGKYTYI